ncbi:porin [Reyranella sp.]|uniref:porin n=1 Tax=Reyranella sp. TaxID=1929291 RepID=UPI002731431E|nr:porin [Reyranella sp.]MDP2376906.1 porin [Reyranella sp.]
MKKLLLGSTALVVGGLMAAPAMAADPIKVGVGGYYTFYAVAGGISSSYATNGSFTSYNGLYFTQEGEIHFVGQTKLDNGTSVGVNVELEAWNPNAGASGSVATIDEAFLFAFGDWGRVEFGSRDAASYRMYYGAPSALIGFGAIQHNHNIGNSLAQGSNKAYFHTTTQTNTAAWQDTQRINYFTPRFQGLQIGIGYTPKINTPSAGGYFGTTGLAGGVAGLGSGGFGACGFAGAVNINSCANNDYAWQNGFDIGANYLNKFGDVTVAAYGSFAYAAFNPGYSPLAGSANQITGSNLASWTMWVAGLQFGYKGITIGGSIGYDNQGMGANYYTGQDNATRFAAAGIMYETGPWQVSFQWQGAVNNNGNGSNTVASIATGTNAATFNGSGGAAGTFTGTPGRNSTVFSGPFALAFGAETANKFELGANYALGPGVKLTGGGMLNNQSGPSNAVTGNAWAILLGMDVRF